MDGRPMFWGRKLRGKIVSQVWDNAKQVLLVVYRDELGAERGVSAHYDSDWSARQAVLDDLMRRANAIRELKGKR